VPRRMVYDRWLFFTAGLLVLMGLIMVGSASQYEAMRYGHGPAYYLLRHALHLLVGVGVFYAAISLPYSKLADRRLVLAVVGVSFVALVAVLMMPAVGGAHRWFRLGPLAAQPSELAKLAAVLFTAFLLARKEEQVNEPWAVPVPVGAVAGGLALLIVIEPDLGSAIMLALAVAVMLFTAGLAWKYIGMLAGVGAAGLFVAVIGKPYRLERIRTYLDPTADTLGSGFQLGQSLVALGSGGVTGVGLGQGQQKAFYLPAAHTDFIFSVVGEELGIAGTSLLLAAFLVLFWRGIRTALRAPDRFGFYLALGLTVLVTFQGLIHMGVCVGLLPTKGLPLPFVSYGGSSLLATLAATGILLNVSQHAD
jgi:cell division protein FtsW